MNKEKRAYLRADTFKKDNHQKRSFFKNNQFLNGLLRHEYPLSFLTFIIISLASGVLIWFIYRQTVKSDIIALGGGILAITIPYLILATRMQMSKTVEDALSSKEFVLALESSLRFTNSTSEVILAMAEEKDLSTKIRKLMQSAAADIRLGESAEKTLSRAISSADDKYIRMALTVLKINNDVGSEETIKALDNILKSMDNIIDNAELLKDKISGIISDKTVFLFMTLAAPVAHSISTSDITASFYGVTMWQWVYVLILFMTFAGQFFMDHMVKNMMKNL